MLAQDRETSTKAKRSRKALVAEEPRPTVVIESAQTPAERDLPDLQETVERPSASGSRRGQVTARPVSRRDSQMVEQATWMLEAMDVLDEPPMALALVDTPEAPATLDGAAPEPPAVTIVTGDSTSKMVAMRYAAPPRKKRHWMSGMIILTLITAVSLTAIATVTPLASGKSVGVAVLASGPLGLPVALDSANQAPTGQWVAVIGVQPSNQDIGGGAGPGVKAAGSAGLPVSSVKSVVNSGAPTASAAGAVSPPPVSPWPPAWAYEAVPGYSAFGMSDVNGYYSWAFGQCTWWAQYERRDENLMHMGNAQYWASGAASRGYSVGWTPRVGATVVFQPGVQGAGGAGHVAHVVKVYPDNWFLISEMNFYWNGGGWGRVDYRFAHAGSGVQFIY
ncbi:MAG TPA: CHAP domain-containing protein [Ktedonobacterales bacterium]